MAREARYHNHCRRDYTRKNSRRPKASCESESLVEQVAHREACKYICSYVETNIIQHLKVERLTMIKERYLLFLLGNYPESCNENYKTHKIKNKQVILEIA